jgi:hypothetical protein
VGATHCYDSNLDRRGGEERTLLQPLRVDNLRGKSVRRSGRNLAGIRPVTVLPYKDSLHALLLNC